MVKLDRSQDNPILEPNTANAWEHDGAFNGCVAYHDGTYHMVYRALSSEKRQNGVNLRVSTVGYATSTDGIHFGEHRMLFGPTEDWEIYGCEDPRITFFEGKFYIFYTALSVFPFAAYGIKTAVAVTTDFKTFEKHPVSTFNAKAMALFPERIDGKIAALITINTDMPPAKIAIATFNRPEDMWDPYYWQEWYDNVNTHSLHLLRDLRDQIELGSPPIKTPQGWLVIISYITNYLSNNKDFGIEALMLDEHDPRTVILRSEHSLLEPEKEYELQGDVPNIVFPSGLLMKDDDIYVYYGAADTRVALATCKFEELFHDLKPVTSSPHIALQNSNATDMQLVRYSGNPVISPALEVEWQAYATFNPAAVYADNKVHLLFRAQSLNGTSVVGYASSNDGYFFDEVFDEPIYYPREAFEKKTHDTGNSGCEDPRLTQIDDKYYIVYTAFDGVNPPRVAMSTIPVEDFLQHKWNWSTPQLISPPATDDKDACIVKQKDGKYLAFHRLGYDIWLDIRDDLNFENSNWLGGRVLAHPREDKWDNVKVGISAPPIETEHGWLLIYHGVSDPGSVYKVGAMLLDYNDPFNIIARTDEPIIEPMMDYEKIGTVPNVVFPCGAVVKDGKVFVYYGGADKYVGVATIALNSLLKILGK